MRKRLTAKVRAWLSMDSEASITNNTYEQALTHAQQQLALEQNCISNGKYNEIAKSSIIHLSEHAGTSNEALRVNDAFRSATQGEATKSPELGDDQR